MIKQPSLLLLPLLWLIACTPDSASPRSQLEQAEQQWADHASSDYQLELRVVHSIWHAQTHRIAVHDNQIIETDASCTPAPMESGSCDVQPYTAESFTIPALFAFVRSELQSPHAEWLNVTYDPTYGFPAQISYDDPEVLDEDWSWRVVTFELLDE